MNDREAADFVYRVRPYLIALLREYGVYSGGGDSAFAGNYLPRDGSLAMAGNLNLGGYSITNVNLVDGIDLGGADPFPQYLTVVEADLLYVPLSRQVIAGAGLTQDYTTLANDMTINVAVANTGAAGLTVEADAVRLTSSSNPGVSAKVLATDSSGRLQLVKAGIGTVPIYPLHVQDSAGTQARIAYDTTYYADLFVDGGGNLKLAPTGMLVINAGGEAVVPNLNYSSSIGLPSRKWLTLHVAELQAEILVAREKVVTIGGRFMVAAGGVLISDCPSTT